VNSGTDQVFVSVGGIAAVATASSMALLPNSVEVFTIPGNIASDNVYVAAIGVAGGNTLYVSVGNGI